MSVYPISFSIPSSKIVNTIPNKTKIVAQINPTGVGEKTYIFNTEEEYYNDYKNSLFAITRQKGGWDCMRHYEILACGCIPVFININNCPVNTMTSFPKHVINNSNNFFNYLNKKYNIYNNNNITILSFEDKKKCYELINYLLEYTRNILTTKTMAKYILSKTNSEAKKILYISNPVDGDYLRCLTLHGFKELFGKSCDDYPFLPYIYKHCEENSHVNYKILHGRGFTYTNLINKEEHEFLNDDDIIKNIENNTYDLIIYSSLHKEKPLFDLVTKYYSNNKIVFLCGEDIHTCICDEYKNKGYTIFVREL